MFHSAALKLTAWYVAALCLVCLVFSIPAFTITSTRLRRGAERQTEFLQRGPNPLAFPADEIRDLREKQLAHDRREVVAQLLLIDAAIITIGSVLSYVFAKRTLRPIEEAHAAQSRFTADASHELRTPLATMQTETEVALRGNKLSLASAKQVLRSNLEEINRLSKLSDQLLSLTRLVEGQPLDETVNLTRLLSDEVGKLEKLGATIRVAASGAITVKSSSQLIRQLLKILLDNAQQYGAGQPIDVSLKKIDNTVELRIANGGAGISDTDLPHIFERFYRGSNGAKERSDGHGLGLAIAREIVDLLRAEIRVASVPKDKTAFIISLPL